MRDGAATVADIFSSLAPETTSVVGWEDGGGGLGLHTCLYIGVSVFVYTYIFCAYCLFSVFLTTSIAANDSEFKVHYRHTNYRRMPLTDAQQQWLEAQEAQRKLKSETLARELAAAVANKGKKDGA